MALISLKSLGVTMSAPLFSNLDLTIGAGDRLGIVAANGRGKSTLLKCLTGAMEPTFGDITRTRGLRVGHVEQSVPDALLDYSFHQAVADALPAEQAESELWRVDVVLDSLDVPEPMRERPMQALERRLAAAGADRPRLGHRPGRAAARRADQPSRPRQDQPAGNLAERAAARGAGRHRQP